MKYAIAFDIADDKRRRRAVKLLLAETYRVQKSVFEGNFTESEIKILKNKLEKTIDEKEDAVRYFPLCKKCATKIEIQGIGKKIEEVKYLIL